VIFPFYRKFHLQSATGKHINFSATGKNRKFPEIKLGGILEIYDSRRLINATFWGIFTRNVTFGKILINQ